MAACLLLYVAGATAQTIDSAAHEEARARTLELLERIQDQEGTRAKLLPQARTQIQSGLRQSRADPLEHGRWLELLWFYHILNDDHARARDALEESLVHLQQGGADPLLIADFMGSLSYSLVSLGEIAKAKEYLRRAIVLASQRDNQELLADLYYNLADAYRKTGERLVAQRYFQSAFERDSARGDKVKTSISEVKLGTLARELGRLDEAVQRHRRALTQFRQIGNYWELVTEIELARDFVAKGGYELALPHVQRALKDARILPEQRVDAKLLLLRIENDRADAEAQKRDVSLEAAITEVEALISGSFARQKSDAVRPIHQLEFAEQAIRYYARAGDLAKVNAHGRAAIRLARRIAAGLSATRDDSLAWLTAAQPVLNEYVKALYELDRAQVYPLLDAYYGLNTHTGATRHLGIIGHAFETRAIELFDRYRTSERALLDAVTTLERLESIGAPASQASAARGDVSQKLRERDLSRDAYLTLYRAPSISSTPDLELKVAAALPIMPRSDVMIRYFVQEDVSFGVVVSRGNAEYFDLPPRSQVIELVQNTLDSLQAPMPGGAHRPELRTLAALLPANFAARYRDYSRLIIVADDAVQSAPFAAIDTDREGGFAPLVTRFEIVQTKAASKYYEDRPPATRYVSNETSPDIVVFGDPVIGGSTASPRDIRQTTLSGWGYGLSALPNTRTEAGSISRAFADSVVRSYLGPAATNEILLSPTVRRSRVLHIATHGYFSNTSPDLVGFATSSARDAKAQGFLGLTDLFTELFSSRLVVISGCETMRGKDYTGWGVRSLADGFLSQGAGSVIGTLWSVSDVATAQLMDHFYRELSRNGGNSSLALQAAQRQMARAGEFPDPYYWAGFVLHSVHRDFDQHVLGTAPPPTRRRNLPRLH